MKPQPSQEENFCGVINARSEEGITNNDDYSVIHIRMIHDASGLETKKVVIIGIGDDAFVKMITSVDFSNYLEKERVLRAKTQKPAIEDSTRDYESLRLHKRDDKYNRKDFG